jgi:hypothetical protein
LKPVTKNIDTVKLCTEAQHVYLYISYGCSTGNQELLSDRVAQTTSSFLNVPMPIIDQQQLHLNNHHEHGN